MRKSAASSTEHHLFMATTVRPKTTRNGKARTNGAAGSHTSNGSTQDRKLLNALRAFYGGDFSVRLPMRGAGMDADLAKAFNDCVSIKQHMLREIKRVSRLVGREGRVSQRVLLPEATGSWQEQVDA